jgi:hypothetical protein
MTDEVIVQIAGCPELDKTRHVLGIPCKEPLKCYYCSQFEEVDKPVINSDIKTEDIDSPKIPQA